jgi:uncharacterized membrane protein (DUF2068 family)
MNASTRPADPSFPKFAWPEGYMNRSETGLLRLVALFKLLKAALLIVAGIGILKLLHTDPAIELDRWVTRLGLDPGGRFINHAIQRATNIPPGRIRALGIGTFVYAALFLTEGIGLWLLKRWAEWFTVIATGSLIPVEGYEIYRHPTPVKTVVLIINLAIIVYLAYRIRRNPAR